jgi:hypothetical protein
MHIIFQTPCVIKMTLCLLLAVRLSVREVYGICNVQNYNGIGFCLTALVSQCQSMLHTPCGSDRPNTWHHSLNPCLSEIYCNMKCGLWCYDTVIVYFDHQQLLKYVASFYEHQTNHWMPHCTSHKKCKHGHHMRIPYRIAKMFSRRC